MLNDCLYVRKNKIVLNFDLDLTLCMGKNNYLGHIIIFRCLSEHFEDRLGFVPTRHLLHVREILELLPNLDQRRLDSRRQRKRHSHRLARHILNFVRNFDESRSRFNRNSTQVFFLVRATYKIRTK